MREVAVGESETTLEALLDLVEGGEEVVVTREGRPVARIVAEPPTHDIVAERPTHDVKKALRAVENMRALRAKIKDPPTIEEIIAWKDEGRR